MTVRTTESDEPITSKDLDGLVPTAELAAFIIPYPPNS